MKLKKSILIYLLLLFMGNSLLNTASDNKKRYSAIKPNGLVDPIGLGFALDDIYSRYQLQRFNIFSSIPTSNDIGEGQIAFYHVPGSSTGRLYTILDGTKLFLDSSATGTGDMLKSVYDPLSLGIINDFYTTTNSTHNFTNAVYMSTLTITTPATSKYSIQVGTTSTRYNLQVSTYGVIDTPNQSYVYVKGAGANQVILTDVYTKVRFDTVGDDTQGEYVTTESSVIIKNTGRYLISVQMRYLGTTTNKIYDMFLYKNGVEVKSTMLGEYVANSTILSIVTIENLVAGDNLTIWTYQNSGTSQAISISANVYTWLKIIKLN